VSTLMIVSQIGLWIVVSFLLLTVLALTRQIGLLHRRVPASGARMTTDGPAIGERAPEFDVIDLFGRRVTLAGRTRLTMLVFLSPECSVCAHVIPALRSLARAERGRVDFVVFSMSAIDASNREYAELHQLKEFPIVGGREVVDTYEVKMPPYAVMVDVDGIVRAKGMVNHLEHLESLLTAVRLGHPTLERYMAERKGMPAAAVASKPDLPAPEQTVHA
jgi:methylamine dehydrogenase accessory protein MauD